MFFSLADYLSTYPRYSACCPLQANEYQHSNYISLQQEKPFRENSLDSGEGHDIKISKIK